MSLQNFWYIAAQSKELRHKAIVSRVFDRNIVLFRDEHGKACALLDRCAHRNLPLSEGKVRDGCIECCYHGWRYDGAGKCVNVPSMSNGNIPNSIAVRLFPCIESQGFVWVFPGSDQPTGEPYRFPYLNDRHWHNFIMKTRFQTGVEACLENFLDCPHTAYVHRSWFRSGEARSIEANVILQGTTARAEFLGEPMSDSIVSRFLMCQGKEVEHTDQFILPNISRVDYRFSERRQFVIVSQCTPISEHETEVYTAMIYCFGKLGSLVRTFFEPISRKIIKQDVDLLEHHGNQLKEYRRSDYHNVETDLLGLHIESIRRKADRGEVISDDTVREKKISIRF